jgi:hypothetical protein
MHRPTALALAAAASLAAATPARAAFAPGEEIVFSVTYLNLPTGEGRIQVGDPEGGIWPVIFQARTEGIAGLIDIREHLVSYWDVERRLPRGSDLRAYEVGDYHQDTARFDRENGQATVTVLRKGQKRVKTLPVPADIHDLTSAFMWLRLQPLAPGGRYELPILSGSKQWTLVAEVVGRERIRTPAGTFPTVKVRVRTALDGHFSTKRDSWMWLSDDPRHVLVRASADFAVGSIVATLKSYRAGEQLVAR